MCRNWPRNLALKLPGARGERRSLLCGQSKPWISMASQLPGTVFILWTLGSDKANGPGEATTSLSRCFLWAFAVSALPAARPLTSVTRSEATASGCPAITSPVPPRLSAPRNNASHSPAQFCQWPVSQPHAWQTAAQLLLNPLRHHVLESHFPP